MIEFLRNNLPELRKLRNAYKYIIVDEYQDCNENQIELLKLLVGKKGNFLFVGDPDQMIYHWRGAKMTYSTNIEKHFKNVTIKNLTINYRFGRKIGIVANGLISNNDNRLPKVLKIHRKDNGIVSYYLIEYFSGKGEANRRLFYVAITRAKQKLYLFSISRIQAKGAYIRCKTSQFLKEIGF